MATSIAALVTPTVIANKVERRSTFHYRVVLPVKSCFTTLSSEEKEQLENYNAIQKVVKAYNDVVSAQSSNASFGEVLKKGKKLSDSYHELKNRTIDSKDVHQALFAEIDPEGKKPEIEGHVLTTIHMLSAQLAVHKDDGSAISPDKLAVFLKNLDGEVARADSSKNRLVREAFLNGLATSPDIRTGLALSRIHLEGKRATLSRDGTLQAAALKIEADFARQINELINDQETPITIQTLAQIYSKTGSGDSISLIAFLKRNGQEIDVLITTLNEARSNLKELERLQGEVEDLRLNLTPAEKALAAANTPQSYKFDALFSKPASDEQVAQMGTLLKNFGESHAKALALSKEMTLIGEQGEEELEANAQKLSGLLSRVEKLDRAIKPKSEEKNRLDAAARGVYGSIKDRLPTLAENEELGKILVKLEPLSKELDKLEAAKAQVEEELGAVESESHAIVERVAADISKVETQLDAVMQSTYDISPAVLIELRKILPLEKLFIDEVVAAYNQAKERRDQKEIEFKAAQSRAAEFIEELKSSLFEIADDQLKVIPDKFGFDQDNLKAYLGERIGVGLAASHQVAEATALSYETWVKSYRDQREVNSQARMTDAQFRALQSLIEPAVQANVFKSLQPENSMTVELLQAHAEFNQTSFVLQKFIRRRTRDADAEMKAEEFDALKKLHVMKDVLQRELLKIRTPVLAPAPAAPNVIEKTPEPVVTPEAQPVPGTQYTLDWSNLD